MPWIVYTYFVEQCHTLLGVITGKPVSLGLAVRRRHAAHLAVPLWTVAFCLPWNASLLPGGCAASTNDPSAPFDGSKQSTLHREST